MSFTKDDLLSLHLQPAPAGRRAAARRMALFGDAIWIRELPVAGAPGPLPDVAEPGANLLLQIDATQAGREAYAQWLLGAGASLPEGVSVAPYSTEAAGLHRLWCLAAARLALPGHVRVQVRHDVVGIRLAQIALGFGVDTFAGPLEQNRKLPVAGVTRPDEATHAGIATLIEAAGLRPVTEPNPVNRAAS